MKIIWQTPDDAPPPKKAIEWAVSAIAARAGLTVPADATVVLNDKFVVGSYPLAQAIGPDGDVCWYADYDRVIDEMSERTDAEMRAAGEDPGNEADMERQVYRLLRRQLIHWPEAQVHELRSVLLPILQEVVASLHGDEDG